MKIRARSFCLVGPGRVGSSVGMALIRAGWRCDTVVMNNRGSSTLMRGLRRHFRDASLVDSVSSLKKGSSLFLITVSDDMIGPVAEDLAKNNNLRLRNTVTLHVSGIVPVGVLGPLRDVGVSIGALHPASPFARRFSPDSARNIYYDFFGDEYAGDVARKITRALSSKIVFLRSERQRELLHVASVIVSNFTVLGMQAADKLVSGIIHRKDAKLLLEGLLNSTALNLSAEKGVSPLTGPLARGDMEVIAKHLKALESKPVLLQFYRSASLLGVDVLMESVRTPAKRRRLSEIRKLLEG